MRQIRLTCLIILLTAYAAYAQDPQFSQFYSHSTYLNPAFTGNTVQGRISMGYRNQWPGISGKAYTSSSVAYDQNLPRIKSGVGILFVHDKAGSLGLNFANIGLLFAKEIKITNRFHLRTGAHAAYTNRGINFADLTFGDQLINKTDQSAMTLPDQSVNYLDVNAGAVFYSRKMWVGFSTHHLNQPSQSLIGGEAKLPIKYSVHGGYKYSLSNGDDGSKSSGLTATFNYKKEQDWDQFDMGVYYNTSAFVCGIWYRGIPFLKKYDKGYVNNDAVTLILGIELKRYWLAYSYDITISKLYRQSGGAHEISLVYEFASKRLERMGKKKDFIIPCAKF
ncbi:MAG: PorP/SprF family type IX secretion system membrane protein [Flavobacteriales bacterium]|nr:PorP/SprF family type IX secretion system membrane protein [Flavobacteriales bacterium]